MINDTKTVHGELERLLAEAANLFDIVSQIEKDGPTQLSFSLRTATLNIITAIPRIADYIRIENDKRISSLKDASNLVCRVIEETYATKGNGL